MTELEIWGLALSKLGAAEDVPTSTTTAENTVVWRTLNLLYAKTRDLVLAEYPYRPLFKVSELKKKPGKVNDVIYWDDYDIFISVGDEGHIFTSVGGLEWTHQKSGVYTDLNSIAVFGSMLVAIGDNGVILTSTDGVTWTQRTSGTTKNLYGVTCNGTTLCVVVGAVGMAVTSPDGVTWTIRTTSVVRNLRDVAYGNSTYCAVGDAGTVITSANGIAWTAQAPGVTVRITSITYGATFAACGFDGLIATSADGATWTTSTWRSSVDLTDVQFISDTYVIIGDVYALVSSDAATWSEQSIDTDNVLTCSAYSTNDDLFVILGDQIGFYAESVVTYTGSEDQIILETLAGIGTVYSLTGRSTGWVEIDFMAGYGYTYVLMAPTDAMRIIGVTPNPIDMALIWTPVNLQHWGDLAFFLKNSFVNYQRIEDYICIGWQFQLLTTAINKVYVAYTRKLTNTEHFSDHLCNAIAARLALALHPTIKGQANRQMLMQEYRTAILEARGVDSQQQSDQGAKDCDLWTNVGR